LLESYDHRRSNLMRNKITNTNKTTEMQDLKINDSYIESGFHQQT